MKQYLHKPIVKIQTRTQVHPGVRVYVGVALNTERSPPPFPPK